MELLRSPRNSVPHPVMSGRNPTNGLVMDPWRFDPAAASAAANRVIGAGSDASAILRQWVSQAADFEEEVAPTIAARLALESVPVYGGVTTYRSDAPTLPHHPFVLSGDVPFLPAEPAEAGGAMIAPSDFIEMCLRQGVLRSSLLTSENPILAALALLASGIWDALIIADMKPRASRMVRLQSVRATGRTRLLPDFDPSIVEDKPFEEWWQTCQSQR